MGRPQALRDEPENLSHGFPSVSDRCGLAERPQRNLLRIDRTTEDGGDLDGEPVAGSPLLHEGLGERRLRDHSQSVHSHTANGKSDAPVGQWRDTRRTAYVPRVEDDLTPYWERTRALMAELSLSEDEMVRRGMTRSSLYVLKREYDPDRTPRRYPTAQVFESAAEAFGIEPAVFPEYRLARARELLDEREHGLQAAVSCLAAFDVAQQRLAEEGLAREAQPPKPSGRRARANGRASGSQGA